MYKLSWKSINNNTYELTINDGSQTVINLTPAANPLVLNGDNNTNIFEPIRAQSGNINIIADISVLPNMIASDPFSRPVTLKINNVVKWRGFLQCTTFTQDYTAGINEINLPIISPLGICENLTLDWAENAQGNISFAEFLQQMNEKLSLPYNQFVFPSRNNPATSIQYKFSRRVYSNMNKNTWEFKTYKNVLEDICKLFGWQCQEFDNKLYFFARDVDDYYFYFNADDLTTVSSDENLNENGSALSYVISNAHKIDYIEGIKTVNVSGNVKNDDGILYKLSLENCDYVKHEEIFPSILFNNKNVAETSDAVTDANINTAVLSTDNTRYPVTSWYNIKVGNLALKADFSDPKPYYGACLCNDGLEIQDQVNEDYTGESGQKLRLISRNALTDQGITFAELRTPYAIVADATNTAPYIIINFTVKRALNAWEAFENYTGAVFFSIRRGDGKYFKQTASQENTGSWQNSEYVNVFLVNDGKLKPSKKRMYDREIFADDVDGLPIWGDTTVIDGRVTPTAIPDGHITLTFYQSYDSNPDATRYNRYFSFEDIEIKIGRKPEDYKKWQYYKKVISIDAEKPNVNKVTKTRKYGFSGSVDISCNLTTRQKLQIGYGLIYSSDCLTSPEHLGVNKTPENDLATRIFNYRSRSREVITLDVWRGEINITDIVLIDSKYYVPICFNTNFSEEKETVTLAEIDS